jgi:hypothetical protein
MEIVKVKYISETTGAESDRAYSYFTEEPLAVGDMVKVTVKDREGKGRVVEINVPEYQILSFKDKVKTIPAGSKLVPRKEVVNLGETTIIELPPVAQVAKLFDKPQDKKSDQVKAEQDQDVESGILAGEIKINIVTDAQGLPRVQGEFVESAAFATRSIEESNQDSPRTAVVKIAADKDLAVQKLFQEGLRLKQYAESLVISVNTDLQGVTNDLSLIAKLKKSVLEKKAEYVGPIKNHLDDVNKAFASFLEPFETADRLTRAKVISYQAEVARRNAEAARIEQEKIRLAQDEMKLTGEHTQNLGTVVQAEAVPNHVRTDLGTLGGRDNWKARVVDFKLLPDEYKLPNEKVLNALAKSTKGTSKVPGVEFFNDRGVMLRTK